MIDKIFKAYDVRATYPSPLNEEDAWKVGHATGQFLKRSREKLPADQRVKNEETVVVGRDMRTHSPSLAAALIAGHPQHGAERDRRRHGQHRLRLLRHQ